MSIPVTEQDRPFERIHRLISLSPVAVAVILAALWLAGAPPTAPDLRLTAPLVARPGSTIGLRAWQLDENADGYTVVRAPAVTVELRNEAGITLAKAELRKSLVQGREGALRIPGGLDEVLSLVARAEIDGREVSVERTLYVRDSIESRRDAGRAVNAFQVYQLGPLRIRDAARAPPMLDPRVEEGACVPELRCWLLVWVGEKQARIQARPLSGARVEPSIAKATTEFARFAVIVAGNEGRVAVEALADDGTVVASREVRLPVVPGGMVARVVKDGQGLRLEWEQLGESRPVLVDVFEGRRWVRALSVAPANTSLPALGPGVWRLQVRADLFSDNTAGVSYVVLADRHGASSALLAANAVLANADRQGLDPLAVSIAAGELPDASIDDALRSLFAVPSFDVISTGPGVSSRIGLDEAHEQRQDKRRWIAAGLILMIGFAVSLVLFRVEASAQRRARKLLEALGPNAPPPRPIMASGRGLWAFVLFVFVLVAVVALSKRWF